MKRSYHAPDLEPPTDDELVALVLPWAKEHMPEAYGATLKVAPRPDKFRRYLIRLVERRCEREPEWTLQLPLSVLEETNLRLPFRTPGGRTIEVCGRGVPERAWSFAELAVEGDVDERARWKETLDLQAADTLPKLELPKPERRRPFTPPSPPAPPRERRHRDQGWLL